jgi:DNA-binding phage protein
MPRRGAFDGSRQEHALRALLVREPDGLKTRSGKTLTAVAEHVGLSYGQLWRYISGALPLRFDQVAVFAEAFETTEADLLRACFPSIAPARTLRAVLEAAGLDEDDIQEAESEVAGKNPSRASYRHIAEMLEARAIRRQNERQHAQS